MSSRLDDAYIYKIFEYAPSVIDSMDYRKRLGSLGWDDVGDSRVSDALRPMYWPINLRMDNGEDVAFLLMKREKVSLLCNLRKNNLDIA